MQGEWSVQIFQFYLLKTKIYKFIIEKNSKIGLPILQGMRPHAREASEAPSKRGGMSGANGAQPL